MIFSIVNLAVGLPYDARISLIVGWSFVITSCLLGGTLGTAE